MTPAERRKAEEVMARKIATTIPADGYEEVPESEVFPPRQRYIWLHQKYMIAAEQALTALLTIADVKMKENPDAAS